MNSPHPQSSATIAWLNLLTVKDLRGYLWLFLFLGFCRKQAEWIAKCEDMTKKVLVLKNCQLFCCVCVFILDSVSGSILWSQGLKCSCGIEPAAVRISWLPGAFWRGLQWTCLSWTCVFFSQESGELFNSSKQDFLVLIVGQSGRNLLFANKFHTGLHLTLMSFFSHYSKITFTIFFFTFPVGKNGYVTHSV